MVMKCQALPLFDHLLRPYQKAGIAALRADWRAGKKKLLLELPTGTGKTRTFVLLPKEGARTLVIVPLIELIPQTVKTITSLRKCEADVEQADLSAIPETEFVVASWQTLLRMLQQQAERDLLKGLVPNLVGAVDIDVVADGQDAILPLERDLVVGWRLDGPVASGCKWQGSGFSLGHHCGGHPGDCDDDACISSEFCVRLFHCLSIFQIATAREGSWADNPVVRSAAAS